MWPDGDDAPPIHLQPPCIIWHTASSNSVGVGWQTIRYVSFSVERISFRSTSLAKISLSVSIGIILRSTAFVRGLWHESYQYSSSRYKSIPDTLHPYGNATLPLIHFPDYQSTCSRTSHREPWPRRKPDISRRSSTGRYERLS